MSPLRKFSLNQEMAKTLLAGLHAQSAFKLGEFTLKSGVLSPIYIDLRTLVGSPKILQEAARAISDAITAAQLVFDYVVGVPYGAMSLATLVSCYLDKPLLFKRKEAKSYGTKKLIEGIYEAGSRALIVEDVVTTGASILETVKELRHVGLVCERAICVLDREDCGSERLRADGIELHSLLSLTTILNYLVSINVIGAERKAVIQEALRNPRYADDTTLIEKSKAPTFSTKQPEVCWAAPPQTGLRCCKAHRDGDLAPGGPCSAPARWSLEARRSLFTSSPLNRRLVDIMLDKRTNLCLAVDFVSVDDILALAKKVHPFICALKLHHDAIDGFSVEWSRKLHALGEANDFLVFEDRKYADIGKVVEAQAKAIAGWADVVTVHAVAGAPSVQPLQNVVGQPGNTLSGCLLVAEMSSKDNLTQCDGYIQGAVKLYQQYPELIAGFICQKRCHDDPATLYWTPGVHLSASTDGAGQQWRSIERAILVDLCDVIIVGRGVSGAADPLAEAQRYAQAGWMALEKRNATN